MAERKGKAKKTMKAKSAGSTPAKRKTARIVSTVGKVRNARKASSHSAGPPRTVLITGASTGIGAAFARVFAEEGCNLVLVARRKKVLEHLAQDLSDEHGIQAEVIMKDLIKPNAAQQVFNTLATKGIQVDILINNAGMILSGKLHKAEPEDLDRLLQLNIVAMTKMTRLFIEGMVGRGYGRILNVASIAAFQPIPSLGVYAASKAFVLSLTEAMSEELKGTGVRVSALCPGLTNTDMVGEASPGLGTIGRNIPAWLLMQPERVAKEGFRACMSGRLIHIPGLTNQAGINWIRLQPRWFVRSISGIFARALT